MGSIIIYSAKAPIVAAIREYSNAMKDLSSSAMPYDKRELNANQKFDSLIALLNLEPADKNYVVYKDVDFQGILSSDSSSLPRFAGFEAQIISGTSGKNIDRSKQVIFRIGRDIEPEDFDAQLALASSLALFHNETMSRFRETVEMERKEKSKKRKKIVASIEYITAGIALAIVNNTPIVPEAYRIPSSALGVGITLRGIADIRGSS